MRLMESVSMEGWRADIDSARAEGARGASQAHSLARKHRVDRVVGKRPPCGWRTPNRWPRCPRGAESRIRVVDHGALQERHSSPRFRTDRRSARRETLAAGARASGLRCSGWK